MRLAKGRVASAIIATMVVAGLVLGACGSAPSAPKSGSVQTADQRTISSITKNWKLFFAASTPASQKITLLDDGERFASVIDAQAKTTASLRVTASVSKVTLGKPATTAKVDYSLDVGGKPALTGQTGEAVLVNGSWKVGVSSFCGLLALEQQSPSACAETTGTT